MYLRKQNNFPKPNSQQKVIEKKRKYNWSKEDDQLIMELFNKLGHNHQQMTIEFNHITFSNRTVNQVLTRLRKLLP